MSVYDLKNVLARQVLDGNGEISVRWRVGAVRRHGVRKLLFLAQAIPYRVFDRDEQLPAVFQHRLTHRSQMRHAPERAAAGILPFDNARKLLLIRRSRQTGVVAGKAHHADGQRDRHRNSGPPNAALVEIQYRCPRRPHDGSKQSRFDSLSKARFFRKDLMKIFTYREACGPHGLGDGDRVERHHSERRGGAQMAETLGRRLVGVPQRPAGATKRVPDSHRAQDDFKLLGNRRVRAQRCHAAGMEGHRMTDDQANCTEYIASIAQELARLARTTAKNDTLAYLLDMACLEAKEMLAPKEAAA